MAALRRRDADAFERLYDLVGRRAYGLAYRVLGDGGEAEDAVQDAFLTLWRQADRLDPARGRLVGLLLTIVHRRALDLLRARTRRGGALGPLDLNTDPVDAIDIEALAIATFEAQTVRAGLAEIPFEQREVLELAYFSALSQREIAARLALPVGTVKSRSRLGLEKLRGVLQGSLGDGL